MIALSSLARPWVEKGMSWLPSWALQDHQSQMVFDLEAFGSSSPVREGALHTAWDRTQATSLLGEPSSCVALHPMTQGGCRHLNVEPRKDSERGKAEPVQTPLRRR